IGGGLYLRNNSTAATSKIVISGAKITDNVSTGTGGTGGGGVFLGQGTSVITGAVVRGNTAVYYGGGIQTGTGFTSLTISKSAITGNQVTKLKSGTNNGGGGLLIQGNSGGSATLQSAKISGSVFDGNRSAYEG